MHELPFLTLTLTLLILTLTAPIRAAEFQWKAFPDYPETSRYRCDASDTPFDILAYALGGLPLLVALYLSAKTRNVKGPYSHTRTPTRTLTRTRTRTRTLTRARTLPRTLTLALALTLALTLARCILRGYKAQAALLQEG